MPLRLRSKKGAVLAEAVLSSCIFVPVMVFIIWSVLEVSYAYIIAMNMNEASHLAARALAEEYIRNPNIDHDSGAQQRVFSTVRIPMMVASNLQFSFPADGWVTRSLPRSVTVQCTYLPGEGDPPLPLFPNPDILKLRNKLNIQSSATMPLF
ncbi:MAG: hypothetical protein KGS72_05060 [Cyanobacteria bacterium REEB67]|nr:hypothetical protein [Cyanobacteria bacterium REEB67]